MKYILLTVTLLISGCYFGDDTNWYYDYTQNTKVDAEAVVG